MSKGPAEKKYANWHHLVQRGLFLAMGFSEVSYKRPWIAIANTWNELNPGHSHLRAVAESVKRGVWQMGGTPLEFNTGSICDGLSLKKSYHLPVRDMIAFETAHLLQAHGFAGCVFISGCDKNVPGQLMAAAEADLPSILITGGSMLPGSFRGEDIVCCTDGRRLFGDFEKGEISPAEFDTLIDCTHPGVGACGMMGTANTMQAMTEALGMCLPGSASEPAVSAKRYWFAEETGRQIMALVEQKVTARTVITRKAVENAIAVLMAMGGSTNGILHLTAIARRAGVDVDLALFSEISSRVPFLCDVKPSGRFTVKDFNDAGGVRAIQKEIAPLLDLDAMTVTGRTLGENLAGWEHTPGEVIRSMSDPLSPDGGIVALHGNLAPGGAIIKKSGVAPQLYRHRGPARVFERYQEFEAMMHSGTVDFTPEHVIVIRNEGPRGGPGMQEILIPPTLYRYGLQDSVIITDGRTSGSQRGRLVVHASPEAAAGGPIALIANGDMVSLDIDGRSLSVELTEAEMEARRSTWRRPPREKGSLWLELYGRQALSAAEGAGISLGDEADA